MALIVTVGAPEASALAAAHQALKTCRSHAVGVLRQKLAFETRYAAPQRGHFLSRFGWAMPTLYFARITTSVRQSSAA